MAPPFFPALVLCLPLADPFRLLSASSFPFTFFNSDAPNQLALSNALQPSLKPGAVRRAAAAVHGTPA
jgi:hypothetical protein